jgi:AcrR family transcriptional regulator
MPRTIPDRRFHDLVAAATDVFIAQGYRRTQMADVAAATGLAKGTLYLYVESKDALFDVVLRNADREGAVETPSTLPVPTPKPGATVEYVAAALAERQAFPALTGALARRSPGDVRGELDGILRDVRRWPDPAIAARIVLETLVFWGVHRHWDFAPQQVDDRAAEDTAVTFLLDAVLKEES